MGITAIVFIILIGLLLIWLELLVIPGTTVAGIAGVLLMGAGVYFTFKFHGNTAGVWVLFSSFVLLLVSVVVFLKSNTWKRLSLNKNIDYKLESIQEKSIRVGDQGKTISRLAPSGKVRVGNQDFEAESQDGLIDPDQEIVVTEVLNNKVFVKLKN